MAVKPIGTTQLTWGSLMGRGNREPLDDTQSNYSYTDLLWELNQRTGNPSDAAYTIGANKGGSGNFYVGLITSVPYVNDDITDTKKKIANSHYTKQSDGTLISEDLNLKGPWYVSYCGTDTRYGNNGAGKYGFNPDGNGNTYYADRIVLRQELNYALDKDYVRKTQLGTYYTGVGLWYDSYTKSKEYAAGKELPDNTYFATSSYAEIFNDYTNNKATGTFAHAEGTSTNASGLHSHAEGHSTTATAEDSHAEGNNTTASGLHSHAEGYSTTASGENSHTEGTSTKATKSNAHSEGIQSKANAEGAHAEGNNTIVDGEYGHSEGNYTSISENGKYAHTEGTYTYVLFTAGHAEGYGCLAYGIASHVEGKNTITALYDGTGDNSNYYTDYYYEALGGAYAHAEGYYTRATGIASHAEGNHTRTGFYHIDRNFIYGSYSHAEGSYTQTTGEAAHAEGLYTAVYNGTAGHAEGSYTISRGDASHAEGSSTEAIGISSHAEGISTVARGIASHAEGYATYAIGVGAHTEGYQNRGNGPYSHIEGFYNTSYGAYSHSIGTYNWTYENGIYSLVEGQHNNVYSISSHTEGDYNDNYAEYSHIEGHSNVTYGNYSHLEGRTNIGYGLDSHVEGYDNVAYGDATHVQAIRNMAYGDFSNISGTLNVSYKDATYSNIEGCANVAYGPFTHIEGANNNTYGPYSHIEGNYNYVDNKGNYSHIEGTYNVSFAPNTQISGYDNVTGPNAEYSHVEGKGNFTNSPYTHLEGYQTHIDTSSAECSHTEGYGTTSEGQYTHAEGSYTMAIGIASHSEGNHSVANGIYSHTEGYYTVTNGPYSHAEGFYTNAQGTYSHVEGTYTYTLSTDDYNDSTGENAHAEGYQSRAYGDNSHAEGYNNLTYFNASHAEGHNNIAKANYAHAEGESTFALAEGSHTEGLNTDTSANYSHAEGDTTITNGEYSHAEGHGSVTYGESSHAEGVSVTYGFASHSEGFNTKSVKEFSHSEGAVTYADAPYSHTEGAYTMVYGYFGHAEGAYTSAYGVASHSSGFYTIVRNNYENASGFYNKTDVSNNGTIFTIGTGTSDTSRHNALAIYKNGTVNVDSNANITVMSSGYFLNTTTTDYVSYIGRDNVLLVKNNFRIAGNGNILPGTYIESLHSYIGNKEYTNISGTYSIGLGSGLKISSSTATATSKFNKDENAYFMVGIGTSDTNRKNAFWISQGDTEGTNGVAYFSNNTYVYANDHDPGQYPNNTEDKSWSAIVTYNMYRNSYTYLYKTVTDKFDTFGSNTYFVKSVDAFTYTPTSYTVHFTTQKFDNASNSWPTTTYKYDLPQAIPGALENDNTGMAGLMSARDKARLDSIWEGDKPISTISISSGTWTIYKNDGTTTYSANNIKYISSSATKLEVEYGFKPQWTGTWKWDNDSNAKKNAERCTGTWGTTLPTNNTNSSSWTSGVLTNTGTVCSEVIYAAKRGLTILNYSNASNHLGAIVPASGEDSTSCSVTWSTYRLLFYGKTTQTIADTKDISTISGLSSAKITGRSWTINYVADGSTCFVMAYPADWGPINTIKKNGVEIITSSFLQVGQVDYTNGAGLTQKYYVYRSGVGTASMSITIN